MSSDKTNKNRAELPVLVAITGSAARTGSLQSLLERLPRQEDVALVVVLQHREALDEEPFRAAIAQGGHELVDLADGTPVEAGRLYLPGDLTAGSSAHSVSRDEVLRTLLKEARISGATLHVTLDAEALAPRLGTTSGELAPALLTLTVPFTLRRRGVELKLIAGASRPAPDATLIGALAKAHRWAGELREGKSLAEIASREKTSESYIRTRTPLAFLSPHLQAAILEGRQPPQLMLERLVRTPLPLDWAEQEQRLGLGD